MSFYSIVVQVLTLIWLVALAFPQRDWSSNVIDDAIIFDNNDEANSTTYMQNIILDILDIIQRRLLIFYQTNFNKMLFYLLIAASPFVITAFPQNNAPMEIAQVDDFTFDGPVASESNGRQEITSTSTTTTSSILNNIYNACKINCPVTSEYNPVCGTDNADYTNPGSLDCAKNCGRDVELNYYGRCSTNRTG
ncbi:PREDICTED: uncharacterized protein LOC105619675 [Atta cephalotes]|uniref:Kazal-like domain-containing protein n=1 Tax=Atta cephalotes TaxID=12957 RepID=A0A158NGC6_ATTCE|nr:PREDICTED: uncharacterized protein LOC105619675 [Atta cephalotes]